MLKTPFYGTTVGMERISQFFSDRFMAPHGFCLLWLPEILWLHVIANAVIALAYFSIPLALWHFARRRPDMPFQKVFILFAAFITLCGLTHVFGILVMWKPYYGIEGLVMLATGIVSAFTAVLVWKILPAAIKLPSPAELAEMNNQLSRSYEETEQLVRKRTAELETANKNLHEAREKADKASLAKTEFLANMSHEIRTPMNVVLNLAEILKTSGPLTDKQEKYIDTLKTSADSLLSLIDDLLDIAKIESNRYEIEKIPFNIYNLTSETAAIMEVRANQKDLGFSLEIKDDIFKNRQHIGDPKRLRQILFNLCSNAIKFTDKGHIAISLERGAGSNNLNDNIILSVSDTGIGIDAAHQEKIFEKFVQADSSISRRYGGSGLGLAIVRNFVERMNGELFLDSAPGKGSVFKLRLPMKVVTEAAVESHAAPSPAKADHAHSYGRGKKILLAEDYEPNVLVASVFLEQNGYICDIASNGDEAVEKYKDKSYALILMDVQMPGKNGWEATEEIRRYERDRDLPPVRIVGMTAHAYAADYDRCIQAGMDDYISKPYTEADLIRKVRTLLAS